MMYSYHSIQDLETPFSDDTSENIPMIRKYICWQDIRYIFYLLFLVLFILFFVFIIIIISHYFS